MTSAYDRRIRPAWWTVILLAAITTVIALTGLAFTGRFVASVPITVTSDRAGLVMETGSKVKLRGVQVGVVQAVNGTGGTATLELALRPDDVKYIPENVQATIKATTIFGAKYVDLTPPESPAGQHIQAGAVVQARNVTTEVNTAFENLTSVLDQVDPPKLNAVLTSLATALRGKGDRLGQATVDTNDVLEALNTRTDIVREDLRSLTALSDTYAAAAPDLVNTLAAVSTTGATITKQAHDLNAALLAAIGLSNTGTELLEPNVDNFVHGINDLRPTTDLLYKYNPEYTCTLQGAYWSLTDGGGSETNGYSTITDIEILGLATDPYRNPENLPIIAAKGGPGGKPGCNGLPRPDLNMPIRYLVTNTGFGTGMDMRPNPGIAHPFFENFFPVTKAVPEPPRIYGAGPPAIGPVPYPGAPPYGAPLFGPDGEPLWAAPPPGAPPPPVPGVPVPPPPYGPGPDPAATPAPTPEGEPTSTPGGQP